MLVRVFEGTLKPKQKILLWSNKREFEVQELGVFTPFSKAVPHLMAGEVGICVANVKDVHDAKVGDTVTDADRPVTEALPGFKVVKPMVFSGVFPIDAADYEQLRDALDKLKLNDSAFTFEAESSQALGFGYRCGYLGLLHMEIVQERLEREYNLSLITTAPSVVYRITDTQGAVQEIDNPAKLPPVQKIAKLEEPVLTCHIHARTDDVGAILKLCQDRRGVQKDLKYIGTKRVQITYDIPLAEVVFDFFDKLKSVSRGYASLDYELKGYQEADLVKLDILINGEPVDALSVIVHRENSYFRGRDICAKLKEEIPKQMYEVAIQAAIGAKVIARETVKAFRKNVIAGCWRRHLLQAPEKQKEEEAHEAGRQRGDPQSAFLAVLRSRTDGGEGGAPRLLAVRWGAPPAPRWPWRSSSGCWWWSRRGAGADGPALLPGDRVLVSRLAYRLRVPPAERPLLELASPRRGDLVVFEDPRSPGRRLVRRVVGLPGDLIELRGQVLHLNGVAQPRLEAGLFAYLEPAAGEEPAQWDTCRQVREVLDLGPAPPATPTTTPTSTPTRPRPRPRPRNPLRGRAENEVPCPGRPAGRRHRPPAAPVPSSPPGRTEGLQSVRPGHLFVLPTTGIGPTTAAPAGRSPRGRWSDAPRRWS
jgi:hypothetical protein